MSVRRLSEADFGEKIQHFLRPSKPVVEPNMLRGREQQLALIRQALYAEGRSVFIYGERGVGKSSLARIAASQYREGSSEFPYVLCEPHSSLESVLVALARQVGLDGSEEEKRTHRFTARLWNSWSTRRNARRPVPVKSCYPNRALIRASNSDKKLPMRLGKERSPWSTNSTRYPT